MVRDTRRTLSYARALNLPHLSAFGLLDSHISQMVELAKRASSMRYNPVTLDDATLSEVLRQAL